MANRDEQVPIIWFSPLDALRRVQELGAQLSGTARSFSEPQEEEDDAVYDTDEDEAAAKSVSRGSFVPRPFAGWAERAAELSTMWVAPMRAVLQEQQDLIDAVSSWAEEQRKLADRFSELADRHRRLTEGVMATLTPTLDHLDRLARADVGEAGRQAVQSRYELGVDGPQTPVALIASPIQRTSPEPARVVIDDDHQALVATPVGDLVDPDQHQPIEGSRAVRASATTRAAIDQRSARRPASTRLPPTSTCG